MKLIDQIVETLNDKLLSGQLDESVFHAGAIYGLSYLSTATDGDIQRPYIWRQDRSMGIEVNDIYPFSIYHRCNSMNFSTAINSYGDGNGMVQITADMIAVVYADRYKIGYTQEDLIMKIAAGLSQTLTSADLGTSGLQKVKASVVRANNNSMQVFSGEYGNEANCPFQLSSVYFGIQYQLEIVAHSDCLGCANC